MISHKMDAQWVVEGQFEAVIERILRFECAQAPMLIKPIRRRPDFVLMGCYVPTLPRPTSLLSGKIIVRRLAGNSTEIKLAGFQSGATPFVELLKAAL